MKTIKILFVLPLALFMLLSAEVKGAEGYKISGKLLNNTTTELILQEVQQSGVIPMDTAKVDEKGKFEFKGKVEGKMYALINLGPYRNVFFVLDNNSAIKVEIDGGATLKYTVNNNPDSEDIAKLANLIASYNQQILDINGQLQTDPALSVEERSALSEKVSSLMAELKVKQQAMLKTLKSTMAKVFAIEALQVEADLETETSLLEAKKKQPANKWLSLYSAKAEARLKTAVGATAPDIALGTPQGDTISLSSLRGKYVLIDFWASWCKPCRAENPNVLKVYNQYKDKGFEILGVSLDKNPTAWTGAIEADGLIWKHISDLGGWQSSAAQLYSINSIPQTILLNKEGVIIAKGLRGEQLEKKLAEVLD